MFSVTVSGDFTGGISIAAWPRQKYDAQHPADWMYDFSTDYVYVYTSGALSASGPPRGRWPLAAGPGSLATASPASAGVGSRWRK